MTPTQLIERLNLPYDQIERIKGLAGFFADFEEILHRSHGERHAADTPLRQGILTQAQNCVDLMAGMTGEKPDDVLQTLLTLFGLSENQFKGSCTSAGEIVALSALVEAKQP